MNHKDVRWMILIALVVSIIAPLRFLWADAVQTVWKEKCEINPNAKKISNDYLPPDIKRIIEKGTLTVGVKTGNASPFFFDDKETNELRGLDRDLAVAIGKELGVCVEYLRDSSSFDGVVNSVINGKVDLAISKLSITSRRTSIVLFSIPYVEFRHAILINRKFMAGRPLASTIDRLRKEDIKLGVINGSSYHAFAEEILHVKVHPEPDWSHLVDGVVRGNVSAIYRDEFEIQKVLSEKYSRIVDLAFASVEGLVDKIAIAVPSESIHLKYWIDAFLNRYFERDPYIRLVASKRKSDCAEIVEKLGNKKYSKLASYHMCRQPAANHYDIDAIFKYMQVNKISVGNSQ